MVACGGVFFVPYFLNRAYLGDGTNVTLMAIQTCLVLALGGAIMYLIVFNRRTRQSLHDLIVGAVVVRARRKPAPRLPTVWKGHVAIFAGLIILVGGLSAFEYGMLGVGLFKPLFAVERRVGAIPGVNRVGVFNGFRIATGRQRENFMTISAFLVSAPADDIMMARHIAAAALAADPAVAHLDRLSVTLLRGYDIGIASNWRSTTIGGPPAYWKAGAARHR